MRYVSVVVATLVEIAYTVVPVPLGAVNVELKMGNGTVLPVAESEPGLLVVTEEFLFVCNGVPLTTVLETAGVGVSKEKLECGRVLPLIGE